MGNLLDQARNKGAPIIDDQSVTFVWEGESTPALIADFTEWEETPILLTQNSEMTWIHEQVLPNDAYIEYAYLDLESEERIPDPFNQRCVPNGFGEINHFFHMPGAIPNQLIRPSREIDKGTVSRHQLPTEHLVTGKQRRIYLYQPSTEAPCPLIVVLDGNDYLRRGKITQILDNLIAQNRVRPVALALVTHGGDARAIEYLCSEATLGFLYERVLSLANQELNLIDLQGKPGAYGIMGASMGGLMALYTSLRMPDIFGHLLSQSGMFSFEDHELVVMDMVRYLPVPPVRIWMDVGKFEYLLASNRGMHQLMVDRGYQVHYREYQGGHNYTSWRNDLWRGMEFLFPVE